MNRILPGEFEAARKQGAFELGFSPSGYQDECPNCTGSSGILVTYRIDRGPMRDANGGKCKWLDHATLGSGWYMGEEKFYPCPVCSQDRLSDYCRINCGLDAQGQMMTVGDLKTVPGKTAARKKALDIINSKDPAGFVTLHGEYGTGKTHVLKIVINALRMQRTIARYVTLSDILAEIKDRFGDRAVTAGDIVTSYQSYKALAIDEVDKINLTDWSRDILFQLMDARYNRASDQLTILAMNMTPEAYGKKHDMGYLSSRMIGGDVIEVSGADMRKVR